MVVVCDFVECVVMFDVIEFGVDGCGVVCDE